MRLVPSAVTIAHELAKKIVRPGDTVVDATAGNGNDTIYLAQLVGPSGLVFSFDIQAEAILATRDKLVLANLESRVKLIQDGHENLDKYLSKPIKLIIFNLGYLPGGDKCIITKPATTLAALKKSLSFLESEGLVLFTVYTGHPGGQEEWESIQAYIGQLPKEQYDVVLCTYLNRNVHHPFTIMIQKLNNG